MRKYIILAILTLLATAALAHSWYPFECCSDGDCHPVPCDAILENAQGYIYDGIQFTKQMARESMDAMCHACWGDDGAGTKYPHCLFLQSNA